MDGYHGGKDRKGMGEKTMVALETETEEAVVGEDFVDPEAPKVTKIKR